MKKLLASVFLAIVTIVPCMYVTNQVASAVSAPDTHSMVEGADVEYGDGHSDEHAADTHSASKDGHSDDGHGESGGIHHFGIVFLMLAVVLIAGKLGNFVEKLGQPAVIGELLAGVILGAMAYFFAAQVDANFLGSISTFLKDVSGNEIIAFISQFGALLLLFSIGLESNIKELAKVGTSSLKVAVIGVVAPFVLGTLVFGNIFYSAESSNARLFLGAALVATSVGITSSVLRTLKLTKTTAAKTFLGATVIDDVVGLIILAVVSALATGGDASVALVAELVAKSVGFLVGAIVLGTFLANPISKLFSKISDGIGMKLTLAIGFALVFGYLAELFGLEPIIGAFAAGLLLDAVHFESFSDPEVVEDIKHLAEDQTHGESITQIIKRHRHAHVEDLIGSISLIFVPVFFVYTGMQIDTGSLLQPKLWLIAAVISVFAFLAKMIAGLAADGSMNEKLMIGASMAPRGEVGLIFASTGKALGVLSDDLFSTIVLVVIMTTFVAPTLIKRYGMRVKEEQKLARVEAKSKEAAKEKRAATIAAKKKAAKLKKKSTKKKK